VSALERVLGLELGLELELHSQQPSTRLTMLPPNTMLVFFFSSFSSPFKNI
jgi:hypothetical protein